MKVRSFYDAIGITHGVEHIPIDSDTVPDMSLSVKDILLRFRRGTADLSLLQRPSYDGTDDIDDDTLDGVDDLVDVYNLKNHLHGKVSEILRNSSRDTGDTSPGVEHSSQEGSEVKE